MEIHEGGVFYTATTSFVAFFSFKTPLRLHHRLKQYGQLYKFKRTIKKLYRSWAATVTQLEKTLFEINAFKVSLVIEA
jgi:hypothetical protein